MPAQDIQFDIIGGSSGNTDCMWSKESREFQKMAMLTAEVPRDAYNAVDPTEMMTEARLYADDDLVFGGILRDTRRSGDTAVEVIIDSYELAAQRARPGPPGTYSGTTNDDAIVGGQIDEVTTAGDRAMVELFRGTLDDVGTIPEFQTNRESPAKRMRRVANITGAELKYNDDKTVDYRAPGTLGRDKTGETTLSPDNSNIEKPEIESEGGLRHHTHLSIFGGAGRGEHQNVIAVKPSGDSTDYTSDSHGSYDGQTTYASDWSPGDGASWGRRVQRSMTEPEELEQYGKRVANEVSEIHTDIKLEVPGIEIRLGDRWTIDYSEEGVASADYRAQQVEVERSAKEGTKSIVHFSTLNQERADPDERKQESMIDYEQSEFRSPSLVARPEGDFTTNTSPDGKQIVEVLTSSASGDVTVTLSDDDLQITGSVVRVTDHEGNASTNNIIIEAENGESIYGGSSTISADRGTRTLEPASDGDHWVITN